MRKGAERGRGRGGRGNGRMEWERKDGGGRMNAGDWGWKLGWVAV